MRYAKSLRISGHVQGVFFREYIRTKANTIGVSGWVRNRKDGSVEAFVQGSIEQIDALIVAAHTGPPASRVDAVEVSDSFVDPEIKNFTRRETV